MRYPSAKPTATQAFEADLCDKPLRQALGTHPRPDLPAFEPFQQMSSFWPLLRDAIGARTATSQSPTNHDQIHGHISHETSADYDLEDNRSSCLDRFTWDFQSVLDTLKELETIRASWHWGSAETHAASNAASIAVSLRHLSQQATFLFRVLRR
jgi:hypothetical protein